MVSPSSVTPSRRMTRSQSAIDRKPNPKKILTQYETARGGSFTVPQNTADGKTNRDNSHADPTGMEVPKKRRSHSGDGIDEAEKCGSDSKKHKKNNGDGFSEDETMRMHDNHCDGRTPNDRFWEKVGDESPISGLNLLAEEVEKGTWSDNVYKDPQENSCRILTVWPHPESYVLPEDVTEEQAGKASPTNSKITRHRQRMIR
ncbi:hypothetical protein Bca52824_001817 [Brassica carinata]|uniref:Uncharacterized protein n=1 Tax=Brassica carinata TaxID=52824 RepID=A0A8X8BDE9_BRACI|nr:hypothetical protein Bca52824_001817 [Brassica carinata]